MDTIIIKSCANAFEAEVVKGALESAGINCFLQGENISVIYGSIGGAFAVDVIIDEADAERAQQVLADINDSTPEQE